jgi:hypothetical protein
MHRFAKARKTRREPGKMNKTEARYVEEVISRNPSFVSWRFEAIKFRLADKTFYTPDFVVIRDDGTIEIHEVKGFWEDDARVKIKVFAEMYPEFFVVSATIKNKVWTAEYFSS